MNTGGFGFSFGNFGDDDDDNRKGNDPFGFFVSGSGAGAGNDGNGAGGTGAGGNGAGGLGDLLNQFGQMFSGMGQSMNSPEAQGPVNFALAERIARQNIGGKNTSASSSDTNAVVESVRLANLWLDEATDLPASDGKVVAWSPEQWFEDSLPMWKRLVNPVAKNMNDAQLESMPEEARNMMGPMIGMMNQIGGMNFGVQLGNSLGDLATQTLSGADLGVPVTSAGVTALITANIAAAAEELNLPRQEVMVYIAAREAARQRLYAHVPWLVERLVASVEEYAAGLVIDTSHIEEAMRELNLESGDPAAIQDAMSRLQGMDLSPRVTSRNEQASSRLATLIALVEGWVDYVVGEALKDRLPSAGAMAEAWRRRRATGGSAETVLSSIVGIEIKPPKVAEAAELWRRVDVAVGQQRRDQVWNHPDLLPTAEQLDNSADFIDGLLDEGGDESFDEEIAKLEEMLRNQDGGSEDKDN